MSAKEMCRACLSFSQTLCSLCDSIVPKFNTPSSSIVDQWKIFTKLLIAADDNFPDKICIDCLAEIQQTYSFMVKCERSEDILKKMKMESAEGSVKRLGTIFAEPENDSSKLINSENNMFSNISNIKCENDAYPTVSQFTIENFGWDDRGIRYNQEVIDRGHYQVTIDATAYDQVEPQSPHTVVVKHEDYNLGFELLDQMDCKDNTTNVEVPPIQGIKQEPELDISTENFESIEQSCTEIVACSSCNFECSMAESLEKHIIDNHIEGQLCKLCNQEFKCSTIEHCSKHLKCSKDEQTAEGAFKCESCPKTFTRKQYLIKHLTSHTGERRFKCDSCSKTFIRKQDLIEHFRCHTGERPFKCDSCPKSFRRKQYLIEHLKRHKGERPFKCESCSKTFICRQDLMQHIVCHTGDRPFKCEICPKTFQRKEKLKYHLRKHTGERPFKCEHCPKSFIRKQCLIHHLKCHTEESPSNVNATRKCL